jgi:hypothetical protein
MIASQIVSARVMGGQVICVIRQESLTITQMGKVKYVPLTLTLAYLKNKELVSIWQIRYDRQQNETSVYLM